MTNDDHGKAVAFAVALFSEAYRARGWVPGPATLGTWAHLLRELRPAEITDAASRWCDASQFPPTPADLKGLLPRFCKCRRCGHCIARAANAARAALDRGAAGADFDGPTRIGDIPPATPPARRLGQ